MDVANDAAKGGASDICLAAEGVTMILRHRSQHRRSLCSRDTAVSSSERRMLSYGFTLLELMVVIGVLTILASFAISSMLGAMKVQQTYADRARHVLTWERMATSFRDAVHGAESGVLEVSPATHASQLELKSKQRGKISVRVNRNSLAIEEVRNGAKHEEHYRVANGDSLVLEKTGQGDLTMFHLILLTKAELGQSPPHAKVRVSATLAKDLRHPKARSRP